MKSDLSQYRVVKKLGPSRHGALKLAERYGEELVCVRHRVDPTGTLRITTVELIVERTKVRARPEPWVTVRIGFQDQATRAAAMAAGAKWDRTTKLWRIPRRAARKLNLQECAEEKS